MVVRISGRAKSIETKKFLVVIKGAVLKIRITEEALRNILQVNMKYEDQRCNGKKRFLTGKKRSLEITKVHCDLF